MAALQNEDCVYPFGIDSMWRAAENQMQYTNSLKMKMAVILGVFHMLIGLTLKIINSISKKKWSELFTLSIPQMLFMICTFAYMDFLIIMKWNTEFVGPATSKAPSIISTIIGIYAGFGKSDQAAIWETQKDLEFALFAVALILVPIMLLGIPIIVCIQRRSRGSKYKEHHQPSMIEMVENQKMNELSLHPPVSDEMMFNAPAKEESKDDSKDSKDSIL